MAVRLPATPLMPWAGNLQTLRHGNGVTNRYQYDARNWLTSEDLDAQGQAIFRDDQGRRFLETVGEWGIGLGYYTRVTKAVSRMERQSRRRLA